MLPANFLPSAFSSVLLGASCKRDRHGFVGQEKALPRVLPPEPFPRA